MVTGEWKWDIMKPWVSESSSSSVGTQCILWYMLWSMVAHLANDNLLGLVLLFHLDQGVLLLDCRCHSHIICLCRLSSGGITILNDLGCFQIKPGCGSKVCLNNFSVELQLSRIDVCLFCDFSICRMRCISSSVKIWMKLFSGIMVMFVLSSSPWLTPAGWDNILAKTWLLPGIHTIWKL